MKKNNVAVIQASSFWEDFFPKYIDEKNEELKNGAPPFDRRFALAYALGVASKIHEDIEKLYVKRENVYQQAFLASDYVDDRALQKLSVHNHRAIQRMLSMMLAEPAAYMDPILFTLYKKAYRFVYLQIKRSKFVDGPAIRSSVFTYNEQHDLPDTTNAFSLMTAIFYLSAKLNKSLQLLDANPQEAFLDKYAQSYAQTRIDLQLFYYRTQPHQYLAVVWGQLAKQYPVLDFQKKQQPMSHFFLQLQREIEEKVFTRVELPLKMLGTFTTALNVHALELQDRKMMTETLFIDLLNYYLTVVWDPKQSDFAWYDTERLFILMYVYMLSDDLTQARTALLDPTISKQKLALEQMMDEQKQLKANLQQQTKAFHYEQTQLAQTNEQLREEVRQLHHQVAKLEKELEQERARKQTELVPLAMPQQTVTYEEQLAFVQQHSFAFVGGTTAWYAQLAKVLPHTCHLAVTDLNKDFTSLNSYDYVCIKTDVNRHTLTDKLAKYLTNEPIFLREGTNIELEIKHVYELLHK